jgi:putative ABC transport system substrate-binding protein
MGRRAFLYGSVAALATPLVANAQQSAKVTRIGYLAVGSGPVDQAFLDAMRDLGYVEGRNLVIDYRSADGKPERLPALAAELVALKSDLIVAPSTVAALAAKQATSTLPIVSVTIPEVASLARPGGNVTGLAFFPELVGKCLEQLKQAVPGVSRVAVLWQPGGHGKNTETAMQDRVAAAARALGVRFQYAEAAGAVDFNNAFAHAVKERADSLTVLPSNLFFNERKALVELAAKHRLPAVYPWREFVEAGGLIAYGLKISVLFRRAATYVDKILKGAKPGDLPVEQPTTFELVINLKTATALGLTIPPALLARADQVIE